MHCSLPVDGIPSDFFTIESINDIVRITLVNQTPSENLEEDSIHDQTKETSRKKKQVLSASSNSKK